MQISGIEEDLIHGSEERGEERDALRTAGEGGGPSELYAGGLEGEVFSEQVCVSPDGFFEPVRGGDEGLSLFNNVILSDTVVLAAMLISSIVNYLLIWPLPTPRRR